MPPWMQKLKDVTVYVGDSLIYQFEEQVNRYKGPLNVTIDLGDSKRFAQYDEGAN